jgi:hypothetical protein
MAKNKYGTTSTAASAPVDPEAQSGAEGVTTLYNPTIDGDLFQKYREMMLVGNGQDAAKEIARLPVDQQERLWNYLDEHYKASRVDALQQHVAQERTNAFKNGERLPGVDATGAGTNMSEKDRQTFLASQNIDRTQEILDEVSQNPDDYSYKPTAENKAELGPYQKYNDSVDPLILAQEEALRQERSDTTGYDAQGRSLKDLDAVVNEQGLTAIDRARMEQIRQTVARQARGQEEAIQADMAERGRGGGTASMLMRQQAQQAATNDRGLYDMQTAALGLERKDNAILNRADIGSNMQAGVDAIDKFNTSNSQDVLMRNTERKNVGTTATWNQNRANENSNVNAANYRTDRQFDYDSGYNQREAAAANTAGQFNAGPNQGARGMTRDTLGVSQSLAGNNDFAASLLTGGGTGQPSGPGLGQSIAGGAMAGAGAGAAAGPWGAAIGGVVGGTAGGIIYETTKKEDE